MKQTYIRLVLILFASLVYVGPVSAGGGEESDKESKEEKADDGEETAEEREERRYKEAKILLKRVKLPRKADVFEINCPWKRKDKYCKYVRKAWKYWNANQWGSVAKFAARAAIEKPQSLEAWEMIASAVRRREGCYAAEKYLEVAASPDKATWLVTSDFISCNFGEYEHRRLQLTKRLTHIRISDGNTWGWHAAAYQAVAAGNFELARFYLNKQRKYEEGFWGPWRNATILEAMHSPQEALEELEIALDRAEDDEQKEMVLWDKFWIHVRDFDAKTAFEVLDELEDVAEDSDNVASRRAYVKFKLQGDIEGALALTKSDEDRAFYTFQKNLIEKDLENFPKDQVKHLTMWNQLVLKFAAGKEDAAITQAQAWYNEDKLSDTTRDWTLFTGGKCGLDAMTANQYIGGDIAEKEWSYQYKGFWSWRCGSGAATGRFNTKQMAPRLAREVSIGWMAGVQAFYFNGPKALETIGNVRDDDSGSLHRVALWTHATFGDRKKVEHHLLLAKKKGQLKPRDYWAFIYASLNAKNLGQAKSDLAKLPKFATFPVVDPDEVGRMRKIIQAAAELDPVFAADLAEQFLVLDGPLERDARESTQETPTEVTMRTQ